MPRGSTNVVTLFAIYLLASGSLSAAPVGVPHSFIANQPAIAAEVNENFSALADAINLTDQKVDHLFGPDAQRFVVSRADGDFTTIAAALANIPNDERYVIDVLPGTYRENIVMKANVHLRGAGREVTTLVAANPGLPTILVDNVVGVAISGLTITGGTPGVRNIDASPRIKQCAISDNFGHGIWNEPNASPLLISNIIATNLVDGIHNVRDSSPTLFNNIIDANLADGMANKNSDPQLHSNRISNNREDGIDNDISSPTLLGNRISGNGGAGVKNFDDSNATIIGNRISDNEKHGIWNNASSPQVLANIIVLNGVTSDLEFRDFVDGIHNENLSRPEVTGNRISLNGGHGISHINLSNASLSANRISDNFRGNGVLIDASLVNVNANRITNNGFDSGTGNGVEIINIPTGRSFVLHNRINNNANKDIRLQAATPAAGSEPNISFNLYDNIENPANAVGGFNLNSAAVVVVPMAVGQ